jgi:DNA-binding IclR family transcriptional regulator
MSVSSERRSAVPALERGLDLVDLILEAGRELAFTEILAHSGLAKASVARLLKVLCERGLVTKNPVSGHYRPGYRLQGGRSSADRLRRCASPTLHRLADLTDNTALLIAWDGRRAICLDRATSENALAMQGPGHVARNPFESAWAWFFLASLPAAEQRRRRREHAIDDRRLQLIHQQMQLWPEQGYVVQIDHDGFRRRLGAPLLDAHGNVIGGLGLGGNSWSMPDGEVDDCGRALGAEARLCSSALGWDGSSTGLLLADISC